MLFKREKANSFDGEEFTRPMIDLRCEFIQSLFHDIELHQRAKPDYEKVIIDRSKANQENRKK